ncbi:MAG: ABC transporter ATP-binding protein [Planctomycetota bacterium]|nr:ABC transporter ATP-binding protein [Planctomycetota bacterium]
MNKTALASQESTGEGRRQSVAYAHGNLSTTKSKAPIIRAVDVYKTYQKGRLKVPVLRGVDFQVEQGEFSAIIGQSGSGKSTLLHLLGTLDVPDQGQVFFGEERIDNLKAIKRDRIRNQEVGMIFQFYHLLPELTTLENVLTPKMISTGAFRYLLNRRQYIERARMLLELVGLGHRLNHKPRELSGGEMQRTAIARALISDPTLLLADEPTGNLDSQTGKDIMDLLQRLNRDEGVTIVMVTHDNEIASQADSVVRLVEGRVQKSRNQAA